MDGILQGLYDFPYIHLFDFGISFVFHVILLRKWFDNRAKNEALLEMIQYVETNNEQLFEKTNTIEKDNIYLTDKIQSMSKGAKTLSERIFAVEFNNQNMLKSMIG